MSRIIDMSEPLSEDEVQYLRDRDDPRLEGDYEVRGTAEEGGLDEVRADSDQAPGFTTGGPDVAVEAEGDEQEPEEKPKRAKR